VSAERRAVAGSWGYLPGGGLPTYLARPLSSLLVISGCGAPPQTSWPILAGSLSHFCNCRVIVESRNPPESHTVESGVQGFLAKASAPSFCSRLPTGSVIQLEFSYSSVFRFCFLISGPRSFPSSRRITG
jgi:hypothetical protein